MIDYFFKFPSEAAAKADPTVQAHMDALRTLWRLDYVLPGIQAWRPSQDTVVQQTGPGGQTINVTVHHHPLAGWFCLIAWPTQVAILLNHSALQFALNRDGPPYVVKNNIGTIISDIAVSPQFLGSHYPVGSVG